MALTITDTRITSDDTGEVAIGQDGVWTMSSYPGRRFDHDQAITAMTLAELYAIDPPRTDPVWASEPGWVAELELEPRMGGEDDMADEDNGEYCWVCGEDGHTATVSCQKAAGMI